MTDVQVSEQRLEIKARRLIVVSRGGELRFFAGTQKERTKKASSLIIDVLLNSAQQARAALATIFLNSNDNFVEMVSGFWKSCLTGANLHFSAEMQAVPGVPSLPVSAQAPSLEETTSGVVYRVGSGVTPPRVLCQQQPVFDQDARAAGFAE